MIYVPEKFTVGSPGVPSNDTRGECLYCDKPAHSRKLCSMHYSRFWRHGSPDVRYQRGTHIEIPQPEFNEDGKLLDDPDFWAKMGRTQRERMQP